MPPPPKESTQILGIPFLRRSCFNDPQLEQRYAQTLDTLNTIQSHAFWMLYNTSMSAVVSAPVGSGKTLLAEGAIWYVNSQEARSCSSTNWPDRNAFRHNKESVVLIMVPERYAVHEAVARLRNLCPPKRRVAVKPLFNVSEFDQLLSGGPAIGVTTPFALLNNEKIDNFLNTPRLELYVFEDLHLLDEVYELAVSKILTFARIARTRIVGTTSSLIDPSDLAEWLGIDPGPLDQWGRPVASQPPALFSFAPSDRGNHISVSIKSFTIPHGPTLLRSMIKPTYDILKSVIGGAIILCHPFKLAPPLPPILSLNREPR